jgi:glyoxylase-like metal-dependent hydrolase (beta-lactamase superfamily II)
MRLTSKKGVDRLHSRTLEQRIEVIPDKLYIHPIPQLVDNLAYLVVCCNDDESPLVAIVIDCGDAQEFLEQVEAIRARHYLDRVVQLHAALCTHKHHDHTAGNRGLLKCCNTLTKVYGSVAERVPYCNHTVANGDFLDLPKIEGNNMNTMIEIEVVSVPGHTRGSVVYALRPKDSQSTAFLFTGDTMFSGGGGVPFEADYDADPFHRAPKKAGSYIRASAGLNAIERCFTEIVVRAFSDCTSLGDGSNVLIFPGHEYTKELLHRQFTSSGGETSQWVRFSPAIFFRTASQLYVASHRRSLPQGKILAVPTLLRLEMDINPNFRKLRRRGEDIVRALQLWYRLFARSVIPNEGEGFVAKSSEIKNTKRPPGKQQSSEEVWNVKAGDISNSIFTAVYTADLDRIISELDRGDLTTANAVKKLQIMRDRAEEPVVSRRAIPATLPSEKIMYNALMGLAIVGSPPTAMTLSDSRSMNLPRPLSAANTHTMKISKKRIISMLTFLGLIDNTVEGRDLTTMIDYLWQEAADYGVPDDYKETLPDGETGPDADVMELGILRWMLFGVETNQPTWFERFCMPCGTAPPPPQREHPIHKAKLRRTNGELVKHDALTCLLCRDVTGCPLSDSIEQEEVIENGRSVNGTAKKMPPRELTTERQSMHLQYPSLVFAKRPEKESSMPYDEYDSDDDSLGFGILRRARTR